MLTKKISTEKHKQMIRDKRSVSNQRTMSANIKIKTYIGANHITTTKLWGVIINDKKS